jgi:hypothetical protein
VYRAVRIAVLVDAEEKAVAFVLKRLPIAWFVLNPEGMPAQLQEEAVLRRVAFRAFRDSRLGQKGLLNRRFSCAAHLPETSNDSWKRAVQRWLFPFRVLFHFIFLVIYKFGIFFISVQSFCKSSHFKQYFTFVLCRKIVSE